VGSKILQTVEVSLLAGGFLVPLLPITDNLHLYPEFG